jgi:hypothetical protein
VHDYSGGPCRAGVRVGLTTWSVACRASGFRGHEDSLTTALVPQVSPLQNGRAGADEPPCKIETRVISETS